VNLLTLAGTLLVPAINRGTTPLPLSRRELLIWAAAILLLNNLYYEIKGSVSAPLIELLSHLVSIGAFQLMAWCVVFSLIRRSDVATVARSRDVVVILVFSLLLLLPMYRAIWVAATGIAIYLIVFSGDDTRLRAAATVLAGLSMQQYWGHIFFYLVAIPLLDAETAAVGTILSAIRPGTVWQGNMIGGPNGFGIIIYNTCSSFHNVSLAILCWLTVSRWRDQYQWRQDLAMLGVVAATMILLNLLRLCLMARNVDFYNYWHTGAGADLFAIVASVTILIISLYGSQPKKQSI
jgi:exosortase/archaeosortase family protein